MLEKEYLDAGMVRSGLDGYLALAASPKQTVFTHPLSRAGDLGAILGIELPGGLTLAAGGALAVLVSKILPPGLRTIAGFGGFAALAYGVADLTGILETKVTEPPPVIAEPTVPEEEMLPTPAPEFSWARVQRVLEMTMPMMQSRTGGTNRNMFMVQRYEFVARNPTSRTLSFYVAGAMYDGSKKVYQTPPLRRGKVSIPAGGQKVLFARIPAFSDFGYKLPRSVSIEGQIFRNRDDAQYFKKTNSISIMMAYLG